VLRLCGWRHDAQHERAFRVLQPAKHGCRCRLLCPL